MRACSPARLCQAQDLARAQKPRQPAGEGPTHKLDNLDQQAHGLHTRSIASLGVLTLKKVRPI